MLSILNLMLLGPEGPLHKAGVSGHSFCFPQVMYVQVMFPSSDTAHVSKYKPCFSLRNIWH